MNLVSFTFHNFTISAFVPKDFIVTWDFIYNLFAEKGIEIRHGDTISIG